MLNDNSVLVLIVMLLLLGNSGTEGLFGANNGCVLIFLLVGLLACGANRSCGNGI